jgi:serine acetyltransferase
LISWIRPGDRYFAISQTTKIGGGFLLAHPYATIINADSVGENFRIIHCTTIGATAKGRPTIGNDVILGANVTVIGNINIGNNVTIGAGSVVTKSVPDNCIVVGNPARIVKKNGEKVSIPL